MEAITGVGGIFFKSENPAALRAWYSKYLGLHSDQYGAVIRWRRKDEPERFGHTVWSPFSRESNYFEPTSAPYMVNFRVTNLRAMLEQLREAGAWVDDRIEESEYGTFGWFRDPDGTRIELWQPPANEEEMFHEHEPPK